MLNPPELNKSPPPCLAELRSRVSDPSVSVAAPFQPTRAIGLIAAPSILSQTLDYLSGYYVPSAAPHAQILEFGFAEAAVCAWADNIKQIGTQIDGTHLTIVSGLCGDILWHARFEHSAFVDLTVFLPDRIAILTPNDGLIPPYLALARLVRNRLSSEWSLSGAAYLHAGCVVIGGRGVVILGAKFSGKTTQICELVSRGASFTSNDRIFIFPDGKILGLPVSVNIRPATLARYDRLGAWRGEGSFNPHRVGMNVPDSDVSLPVWQFADAFGTTISPATALHAVIRLVRNGTASTKGIDIQARNVVDLMASSLFDGIDHGQPFWDYRRSSARMITDLVEEHTKIAYEIGIGEGHIDECACLIEERVMT